MYRDYWYSVFGEMKLAVSKDLVAASATPLILSILAEGENYGYAIIKRVRIVRRPNAMDRRDALPRAASAPAAGIN